MEGYNWFGFNRTERHRNAQKGSGGVGLLVKDSLVLSYEITVIDKSLDDIFGVVFNHKYTDYSFAVFSCYLAPENSPWGREAQGFFAHLLTQIYMLSECDAIFIAADFNARIGCLSDIVSSVESIRDR